MKSKYEHKPAQYLWVEKCPCGCDKPKVYKGTLEEYFISNIATYGSRHIAGVLIRKPKTYKGNFLFNLN